MALALAAAGCGEQEQTEPAAPAEAPEPPLDTLPTGVIRVRGFGEIRIALRADVAPKTVENFTKLATTNFYDGITFHRVIPGFMIQTGDPLSRDRDPRNDGRGGPGYRIDDEPSGIRHVRGVVSMANSGPNTGGSQFFILVGDAAHLDGRHTAFGRVVEGMDVADRIVAVERDQYGRWGPEDRPREDVVIESTAVEPPQRTASAAQP
ncbi:MAG: peptidylprolyl isomerase [Proteobacteria bacterium]|nr:MAG: peptidylprolyl isomerase [Pseudomonadota bacterium]